MQSLSLLYGQLSHAGQALKIGKPTANHLTKKRASLCPPFSNNTLKVYQKFKARLSTAKAASFRASDRVG